MDWCAITVLVRVMSGMNGYGFSSWIRGQLVLQWKRENNREGNTEKENVNWEQMNNHLIDISVLPFPLYP